MEYESLTDSGKAKVDEIKELFGLSDEDLRYKWEAYALTQPEGIEEIDFEKSLEKFQHHLQTNFVRSAKRNQKSRAEAKSGPSKARKMDLDEQLLLVTPRSQIQSIARPSSPRVSHTSNVSIISSDIPSSPSYDVYKSRTDSGELVTSFVGDSYTESTSQEPATVGAQSNIPDYKFRTMYQKVPDSTRAIDAEIERMVELVCTAYGIQESEICNPAFVSQKDCYAIGRLMSAPTEPKMHANSVLLQTCRRFGAGTLIPLDLSALPAYTFFSNEIVVFKGLNPHGDTFIAKEQLSLPALEAPKVTTTTDMKIVVACGPFTTNDNLEFRPLKDLRDRIKEQEPSAVILFGPFLEMSHPLVLSGEVPRTSIQEFFKDHISSVLEDFDVPTILIPAQGDEVGGHVPFPQPPLKKKSLGIPKICRCFPNPAFFTIDSVNFAVSSIDSLQDIMRSEIRNNVENQSASKRCFSHIIEQRKLYPVFPSPRAKVALEVSQLHLANIEEAPSILVSCSSLKPSIEVVNGVLCLNPGLISKQTAAGTYALISVSRGEGLCSERSRVDIFRI